MDQTEIVYEHLCTFGSITPAVAAQMYGITRLASVIYDLRQIGINIKTIMENGKNRYGRAVRYARYELGGNHEQG